MRVAARGARSKRGRSHRRRWAWLRPTLVAVMLLASAFPGAADLAVLSNGHVLKVDDFRVTGEMVRRSQTLFSSYRTEGAQP